MSDAYGATIARRELARRLRELGEESGTAAGIAGILDRHRIQGDERESILALAARARARGWWEDYRDIFPSDFPGYEHDASSIRLLCPVELPRLVHTKAYTAAMLARRPASPAWRRRAAETVLLRQAILDRKDTAPELQVLITQAALEFRWGDSRDRRNQVETLIDLNRRPGIQIRVQAFDDGPPPRLSSPVSILGFPQGHPPALVYVETGDTFTEVAGPESVDTYVKAFEEALDAALEPGDTSMFLEKLASRLG